MKDKKEASIHGLFPTPVYRNNLNRKFSKEELNLVKKSKKDTYGNVGNVTSKNSYILNEKPFAKLKKQLDVMIEDYFNKIICTSNKVKPYITQSWLNYTETNQFHHPHEHPNSIVSGVLYIDSLKEFDKILFINKAYEPIRLEAKEYNIYNSRSWWFPVETGDVVLFPSYLTHQVDNKQGNNTRISLAFNTYVKGTFGNKSGLTELNLE